MCRDPLALFAADRTGFVINEWIIFGRPTSLFDIDWDHSLTDREDAVFLSDVRLFGLRRSRSESDDEFRGILLLRDGESGHYFRVGTFYSNEDDPTIAEEYGYERWERQSIHVL